MNTFRTIIFAVALLSVVGAGSATAQSSDDEELKLAALEALIAAPPERAYPIAAKVLQGNNSDELKEAALFILSQIDLPEAQSIIIETARTGDGDIQAEAIRMIGIGGNADSLAELQGLYDGGDEDVREAVLEAFLIADDEDAVYNIAVSAANAGNDDDFEDAVEMLGAMGAHDQLRRLRESTGISEPLIEAYQISGDTDSLRELAFDDSDVELQEAAIEALGIVGGDAVNTTLVEIYRRATSEEIREAALEGMLISGHDEGVLELYRSSDDAAEKRELLNFLVMMGSDDVWDIIDAALEGGL